MTATYEPIATTTAGSAVTSVTFSSIPSTYTDLVCVFHGATSAGVGGGLRFNSDTGNNYGYVRVYGDGAANTDSASNSNHLPVSIIGTTTSMFIAHVFNYKNTNLHKYAIGRSSWAQGTYVAGNLGEWRDTSAITSVTFMNATYSTNSVFTIYGIKAE
jgi:hypothetical protein